MDCIIGVVVKIITPLEIIDAVIQFIFVLMIYTWQVIRIRKESNSNKPMDKKSFTPIVFTELDTDISTTV